MTGFVCSPRGLGVALLTCGLIARLAVFAPRANAQEDDALQAALVLEHALETAIERAEVSLVSIARIKLAPRTPLENLRLDPFPLPPRRRSFQRGLGDPSHPDFIPNEFGTGIIISGKAGKTQALILTNYHVVKGGPPAGQPPNEAEYRLYVRFHDRRGCYASIFAADPRSDLAVLVPDVVSAKIKPTDLKPIRMGDAENIRKGKLVLVLGNPYAIGRDGSASASWGMISNISRRPAPPGPPDDPETVKKETIHHFGTLLQVDARLNLGTSGGALLNLRGELIGITTALAALRGYEKSVGYAIPLDKATRRIIDSLTNGHEVEYGFLGVEMKHPSPDILRSLSHRFKRQKLVEIKTVFPNSPADTGGLQAGDVILAVNERAIHDQRDLVREVGLLGPDCVARLRVWREQQNRELNLVVELGKWPVYEDEGIIATQPRYPQWRGIEVDFPTARYKFFERDRYHRAVLVTKIAPSSNAALSGELQVGDFIGRVNRKPVATPAEFHKAVQGLEGQVVELRLVDGRVVKIQE